MANSLADVMMIMPSLNHETHFDIGPRDLIHSLSQVLAGFRGGNPAVINILQEKLTTLGLGVGSPRRLLELSSPEEEQEEFPGVPISASSTYASSIGDPPLMSPLPPAMNMHGGY